jgi:hypothetical protein
MDTRTGLDQRSSRTRRHGRDSKGSISTLALVTGRGSGNFLEYGEKPRAPLDVLRQFSPLPPDGNQNRIVGPKDTRRLLCAPLSKKISSPISSRRPIGPQKASAPPGIENAVDIARANLPEAANECRNGSRRMAHVEAWEPTFGSDEKPNGSFVRLQLWPKQPVE